jgi:hypothetical protein
MKMNALMAIKERTTRMNIVVQRLGSKKQQKFSWTASCQDVSTNVVPSQEPVAPGVDTAIRNMPHIANCWC